MTVSSSDHCDSAVERVARVLFARSFVPTSTVEATTRLWDAMEDDSREHVRDAAREILAAADLTEVDRYRHALEHIREHEGKVCDQYEICKHRACQSSYGAWSIADGALGCTDALDEEQHGD